MAELIKIREVSSRYDISARALRYYESMGLIKSTRSRDYAYRLYDRQAIKRLEQILILRKLNISMKDIQLIFQASSSGIVLEVLGKKVEAINGEVALLQNLRDIILEFVEQIKQADFSRDDDVKRLYERAAKVENRIANISYDGNASRINRLLDVTDKLKKAPEVRIIQINPFRAFSSGADTYENVMKTFQQWQVAHNNLVRKMIYGAPDFLWFEEDMKAVWIWAVEEWVTEEDTKPYELIEFEGGLYAAAMSVDGDDDIAGRVYSGI
ncbi:MAG: MerR family transcriptional regulator [Lachnospiraceae bacterium]|nr:MerR family transcriptional regulator [Lachnospiraceae bacterium]